MTTYLSRSTWTSTAASGVSIGGGELVGVAVHWPGTTQATIGATSQSSMANRLRSYRNYHVGTKGWRDIGYNLAIDQAGRVWMLRSTAWHGNLVGAHCASASNPRANHKYVGVLLVLGASEQPSQAMKQAFRDWYHDRFLPKWPGRTDVRGHGQVPGAQTSCPGPRARAAIDDMTDRPSGGSGMAWNEQLKSYVDKDGKDSAEHALATARRDSYRLSRTLLYSGDTNEKSVYATKSGYRRLDSPAYPGTEENPRPTGSSDPDRRGASWRYALQRVWRYAYWGYRRIVRVESKVDSLQQEIAALRGMVETLLQREAGQQVTVEQIRESVRAELLAADERIVNVQISVNDANDPEDDPDVAHDDDA